MKHAFKILTRSVAGILLGALLLFASLIVKDCSYAHSLPSQYPARLGTSVDTMGGLWFFEMYTNDVGYVRTVFTLSASDGKFEGHSREDVSPKLLGWWKNFLGKLFTSDFENGALLHLKRGSYKLTAAGETEFTAEFISAFGEYDVKGKISEGRMRASLHHRGKVVGSIYGSRNIPALPLANYPALTETIIQTAEANLYSDKIARTKDWESFKAEMRNFSHIATDDIEYMFAFFYRSRSLPFTHFNLFQKRTDSMLVLDSGSAIEKLIYTKDLSDSVSYLRVSSFA
ncbi:MAG: hypothetical protein Q8896_07430, partial [Bacteroidota bacterium]|nr:hypothetical protein [Bacteroidota bacterium]